MTGAALPRKDLYIVGIGASAGGLEAMLLLLAKLRPTGRMSYVVAQHMANGSHSDLVTRLLGRQSALPVVTAGNDDVLKPDTVHVIPAGMDGTVVDGTLRLSPPGPGSLSTPSVNVLFQSIANAASNRGIAVVLSGTGADGAAGCRAVRDRGGHTYAQTPEEAGFDGMPRAAINSGAVEKVCAVVDIAAAICGLVPRVVPDTPKAAVAAPTAVNPETEELARIQALVRDATGVDFSMYKEETLLRRIEKRKSVLGATSRGAYLRYLHAHPEELRMLEQLFLVCVSSFFRDPDSFRVLGAALKKHLLKKAAGSRIGIWVPGCATGDEAYTLAIMLCGMLGEREAQARVRIVGTDLSGEALAVARSGVYRRTALATTEPDIVSKYFSVKGEDVVISETLRSMVRFDHADVLRVTDAGPCDLISCRNLLIYLKADCQDRLLLNFHRALEPGGLLFIGQSESLGITGGGLFTPIDQHHRVYAKRN